MLLHAHRRSSLWWPRNVPTVPVAVDWSHPLSAGLIGCYVPGAPSYLSDLTGIGPTLAPDSATAATLANSIEGYGYQANQTQGSAFANVLPSQWQLGTAGTLYWRGTLVSAADTNPLVLFGSVQAGGASKPVINYGICLDPTQNTVNSFSFFYANGSTQESVATKLIPTFSTCSIAASFVVGGAITAYLWLHPSYGKPSTVLHVTDGNWIGSAPGYSPGDLPCINVDPVSDLTDYSGTITTSAYLFNRPLSQAEVVALDADPFCFLKPALTPRYALSVSLLGNPYRRWNRTYLIR